MKLVNLKVNAKELEMLRTSLHTGIVDLRSMLDHSDFKNDKNIQIKINHKMQSLKTLLNYVIQKESLFI